MKRIIKKSFWTLLVAVMLLSVMPFTAFGALERNAYEGIAVENFDDVSTKNYTVTSGAVDIKEKGAYLAYKNVNFYKNTTHVQFTYATGTFVTPRDITLRIDNPETGTKIGTFTLDETANVNNYRTTIYEIKVDLNGVHDLYVIDNNGNAGRLKTIKFSGLWGDTTVEESPYPEQIEVLKGLGIADYSYVNATKLNKPITRRDFSKMVANLFKVKNISDMTFYDVPATDPDVKAMAALYALGAFSAESGYFLPEASLTLEDGYRILLTIMGFEMKVTKTYKGRWSLMATELGLTSGVNGSLNQALTYSDAVKICESSLYVSLPEIEYPSLDMSFSASGERTVLYSIHKTVKGEGIVKATPSTYLSRHTATTSPIQVLIGNSFYNIGESNVADYLGYNIVFYYKNVGGVNTVVSAFISKRNKIVTVNADEIQSYNNRTLAYKKNEKSKTISFKNTADVLFNGVSYANYADSDFIIEEGTITYIDNDGNGSYDVISIESGVNYVVSSVDSMTGIIGVEKIKEPAAGETARLSVATGESYVKNLKIYIRGDYLATVSDINEGDVITVYESKPYNGIVENVRINVSDTVFEDVVTELNTKNKKTVVKTQTGGSYELSKNCNSDVTLGMQYIFHISVSGKVVWLEQGTNRGFKYGYLMNAGRKAGAFDSKFQIKMLTEANKIQIFDCADKLTFDGTVVIGSTAQSTYQTEREELYVKMDSGEMRFIPQLVRYKDNKNGEIWFIDTVVKGVNEDDTSLVKNVAHNSTITSSYFWLKAPVESNTVVFTTPFVYSDNKKALVELLDKTPDSDFSASKLFKTSVNQYSEGYDGSYVKPLGAIVKYTNNDNQFLSTTPWIYITEVATGLDRNGNTTRIIKGISKGTKVELKLDENMNTKFGSFLKPDDLWLYRASPKHGEITFMIPIWAADGTDYDTTDKYNLRTAAVTSSGSLRMYYADEVVDKNSYWYHLKIYGKDNGMSFNGANIQLYDKQTGEIKKISSTELMTNDQATAVGTGYTKQHVFIYTYNYAVKQIIVVRE